MTQEDRDYLETELGAAPRTLPGSFTPEVNRDNGYRLDRASQRAGNATGIPGVNNQDRAIVESMGPVVDRENEHLGASDAAIIALRDSRATGSDTTVTIQSAVLSITICRDGVIRAISLVMRHTSQSCPGSCPA